MAIETSTAPPARRGQRLAAMLPAVGVGLAAFAWLSYLNPTVLLTDDGIRDQLLARDCTDLGRCHLIGAVTSVPQVYQGAVWLDLLTAVRLLGGDTSTEKTVVLALLALSVATLFLVAWRWLGASIALPAAVLLTGALSLDPLPSVLVNPSPVAFPDVLSAAGLLCYGLSGGRRFLILAACALGVAINVHVGSLSLVPSLVAIAALGRPRPWRELLASIAVVIAISFITSRAALLANILGFTNQGRLLPALAGGFVLTLLSVGLGSRFRRLSWETRAWVIGCILLLPFSLASLWLVFWQRHHFSISYLHPILGPAAVFAAAMLSVPFEIGARWLRVLRWIPTAAALAGLASLAFHVERTPSQPAPPAYWPSTQERTSWTLAEAKAIAEQTAKRGWSYESLVFRIQSNACRELLVRMSIAAPAPNAVANHDRRQLQVVSATSEAVAGLASPRDVVPLGPGRVAIVREIESWLTPEALVACRRPVDAQHSPVCSAANQPAPDTLTPERFLFARRSFPEIHGLDLPAPYIASYEIPLAPVAGESRDLAVADHPMPGCQGWRITRAEGVQVEGQLPAEHVRLHSDNGSPGVLVLERPFGTCAADVIDMRYPPCIFEMSPDDPLRALTEAG